MKVFISWSGDQSRQVAEVFRDWLPSVIQAINPYVSSEDIDKGARWSADISRELEESNYGILCVTRGNLAAPWLNFEAGALSKSFDKSRVSPFLFQIGRNEVTGPLLQFQSTVYERDDVLKLLRSINTSCEPSLDEARLDGIFEVWWPTLKEQLDSLVDSDKSDSGDPSSSKRSTADLMNEILALVRAQQKILSDPTELLPPGYIESILRRADGFYDLPPALIQDVADTWIVLRGELTDWSKGSDDPEVKRINALVRDFTMMLDALLGRTSAGVRPRLGSTRRRRPADTDS